MTAVPFGAAASSVICGRLYHNALRRRVIGRGGAGPCFSSSSSIHHSFRRARSTPPNPPTRVRVHRALVTGNRGVCLSLPATSIISNRFGLTEAGLRLGGGPPASASATSMPAKLLPSGQKVGQQEAKQRLVWALQPVTNHSRRAGDGKSVSKLASEV